jgi:beta-N-acetylhexosaminidase
VPEVLESLRGYVDPAAQLRLTRLHGRGDVDWDGLRASPEWHKASALVAPLRARPKLELEG